MPCCVKIAACQHHMTDPRDVEGHVGFWCQQRHGTSSHGNLVVVSGPVLPPQTGILALVGEDAKAGAQGLSNSFVAGSCAGAAVTVDCDMRLRNLLPLPTPCVGMAPEAGTGTGLASSAASIHVQQTDMWAFCNSCEDL